jgi:hypothetical protein
MTKQEILSILDNEIDNARLSHYRGKRNFNEITTDSLLIEFDYDDGNMMDIVIGSIINDPDEMFVYADDLSNEQIVRVLQAAMLEEHASDMNVKIYTGDDA